MQPSTEAVRAAGTKTIGIPASFSTFVRAKSSDRVPSHFSRISRFSNVLRVTAIAPPQQKLPRVFGPRFDATDAFHTERSSDASVGFDEMNQRYPVAAPIFGSESGATRLLSHVADGRASESAKTKTLDPLLAYLTATRRFSTFWLERTACEATTILLFENPAAAFSIMGTAASFSSSTTNITSYAGYS